MILTAISPRLAMSRRRIFIALLGPWRRTLLEEGAHAVLAFGGDAMPGDRFGGEVD